MGPLHVYIISLSRVSSSLSNHIIIIYISYLTPLQKLNSKFKNIELSTTIICDKTAKVLTTLGVRFFLSQKLLCLCAKGFFGCRIVWFFFIFYFYVLDSTAENAEKPLTHWCAQGWIFDTEDLASTSLLLEPELKPPNYKLSVNITKGRKRRLRCACIRFFLKIYVTRMHFFESVAKQLLLQCNSSLQKQPPLSHLLLVMLN